MLTMAVGHSDDVDPADAIAAVIAQCRASLGGRRPQAGILFSAFDTFDPSIVVAVRQAFPGVDVMGSTSAAEISSVSGYVEDSVTLALFASDTVDITVGLAGALDQGVDAACAAAVAEAVGGTSREPRVCIMLAEAYVIDPQLTLDAVSRALPDGVTLVGGTSARSDFSTVRPTFQFCNERVVTDGIALLLFSGEISHSSAVGRGWRTIGPQGTVTRVSDTRGDPVGVHAGDPVLRPAAIEEIDGRPAVEFVSRYLADITSPATLGNPFAVFEAGTDEYYLRATTGADPETGAMFINGSVPAGVRVQLTTTDTDTILDGTRDALTRARDAFPSDAAPEAALIFSCAVRKFLLGSRTHTEADYAGEVLGPSVATCGMYCFGEVGPVKGAATSRYFNETFVTLLLGT